MAAYTIILIAAFVFSCLEGVQPSTPATCVCDPDPPVDCPRNSTSGEGSTYTLYPTQDVWLEGSGNKNNHDFLIIGKIPSYAKKRALIQFEDLSQQCCRQVKSAKIFLYFWYGHKASWQTTQEAPSIPRLFQVHQLEKEWKENEATSIRARIGSNWNQQYVAIDGQDANITPTDCTTIHLNQAGGYIVLDITKAVQNWVDGQPNYGVLIWATNEDTNGRGFRFYSRERTCNKPFAQVLCA